MRPCGAFPSLISALPARFVVRGAAWSKQVAVRHYLVDRTIQMGYEETEAVGPETVFKRAKYKWLSWPESTVRIRDAENGIEVRGPKLMIRILHKGASTALCA
jgi:hypothetical protein